MRRFTFLNWLKASMATFTDTPTWRAAAMLARAFMRLCSPNKSHATWPCSWPANNTSKLPLLCGLAACQSLSEPNCSTGVQQPLAITLCKLSSKPLLTTKPACGTVRTKWWNCFSMAAKSSKMSAWSNSRLFNTAVRGW